MNEREFLDLLRYYFRKARPEDVAEILGDYEAHFAEGRERGLTDEQIAAELGRPLDIYESYQIEGMISEKSKLEKLSDNAEQLADTAQKKVQETWNEVSPRLPDAANATASLLIKVLYTLCTAIAVLIVAVTILIIYLLSMHFVPISGADPLPGLHPLTLAGLFGTGLFAGLAVFYTGHFARHLYNPRKDKAEKAEKEENHE